MERLRLRVRRREHGALRFEWSGKGVDFFVTVLVGYLLCFVTIGIYTPWFVAKLLRFFADHAEADEIFSLPVDLRARIFAAGLTEFGGLHLNPRLADLFFDGMLDRQ